MTTQELQKQKDHEDDLIRLRGFRPVDDTFMRILFRDNLPLAEYVLRIITGKDDLHLTKEETQKDLVRLVGARGLCLDVHGIDDNNQQYDLEVQRADNGARPVHWMLKILVPVRSLKSYQQPILFLLPKTIFGERVRQYIR